MQQKQETDTDHALKQSTVNKSSNNNNRKPAISQKDKL